MTASTTSGGPVDVTDTSDPAQCPPVPITPLMHVEKSCQVRVVVDNNQVVVRVDIAGQVCNDGDIILDNVTVTDDSGTPNNPADDQQVLSLASLAAHTCAPYSGSYFPSGVNGSDPSSATFSDTVTAHATPRPGGSPLTDMHTATCPLCPCPRTP